MTIIPIFIYRENKSDKELREEMERDARWNKLMKEEETRRYEMEEKLKQQKLQVKMEKENAIRNELDTAENRNPWEYRILPDGWELFGQVYIFPIPWDGAEEEYENLVKN